MNTKIKSVFFVLIVLLLPVFNVSAQIFGNIPGQETAGDDLIEYLNNLYKFGISITGILAVFMIALGAFSYIVTSAGNSSKMMNAKEMINNALIGLIIVLTAYLILYVVNPDLVKGTLKAPEELIRDIASGGWEGWGGSSSPMIGSGTEEYDPSEVTYCYEPLIAGIPSDPLCADCPDGSFEYGNINGTPVAFCTFDPDTGDAIEPGVGDGVDSGAEGPPDGGSIMEDLLED